MEECALALMLALDAGDSPEVGSMASRLRLLAQASGAEEDLLIIDAALAAAGCPRSTALPLAPLVASGCLRALNWQRAHGSIARDGGNEHAECLRFF